MAANTDRELGEAQEGNDSKQTLEGYEFRQGDAVVADSTDTGSGPDYLVGTLVDVKPAAGEVTIEVASEADDETTTHDVTPEAVEAGLADWDGAVAYYRHHYGDTYGDRTQLAGDLAHWARTTGKNLPSATGAESVLQALIRYQSCDSYDALNLMDSRIPPAKHKQVVESLLEAAGDDAANVDR